MTDCVNLAEIFCDRFGDIKEKINTQPEPLSVNVLQLIGSGNGIISYTA
jgi:hypothetical protein